jgi:hypothetical protein
MEKVALAFICLGVAWVLGNLLGRVIYRPKRKEVS